VPLYAMLNLIDTLILGIELPSAVVTAINRKIEQYYISEEYKFRVAREIRESERKKIEAEGIAEFQRIVSQGISSSYLRWRGIEATLQLAQSSNSKVVIIGAGQNGMPIILGNLDSPSPSQPAASGGSAATGPKERTTAATPTTPSEQLPADTLPKPSEKTPSVSRQPTEKAPSASAQPSEKTSPASAQPPEAPQTYSSPISWSEIKALFARLVAALHSSSTEEAPPQSPAAPTRAAEAPPQSERASPEQPYPSEPGPPPRRTMGDDVPMPNVNARPWPAPPPPDAGDRSGRGRF
jgi:hypothetical protein